MKYILYLRIAFIYLVLNRLYEPILDSLWSWLDIKCDSEHSK